MTEITEQDLVAFLHERKAISRCISCNSNDWHISSNSQIGAIPILSHPAAWQMPPPTTIGVALMICKNCGFVKSHARFVIEEWKESK
jgi:hypothetical protein